LINEETGYYLVIIVCKWDKNCVLFFFLIDEGTAGDETKSDNKQKCDEQLVLAEDEIQEESESLLDAINKITLIKSC
jgi:hypothetical protein